MKTVRQGSVADLHPVVLKPQDVALALNLLAKETRQSQQSPDVATVPAERDWTLSQLAGDTCLSIGEIHNALRRLQAVRLLQAGEYRLRRHALEEFLAHGLQYVFPAARGTITRGVPTSFSAPMLKGRFASTGGEPVVWPSANGTIRGVALSPLYPAAPDAALSDALYYEMLALADVLRGEGRARERAEAVAILRSYLRTEKEQTHHDG